MRISLAFYAIALAVTGCVSAAPSGPTTLHFDYGGAETLIQALGHASLSAKQASHLQSTHGVMAMVDNVTRYIPDATRAKFESDLRTYLETREEPRYGKHRVWGFQLVWDTREQVTSLIAQLRRRESELTHQALSELKPVQPDTGPLTINVYFVAGGVSDGFVTKQGEQQVLYVNLSRAQGDAAGVMSNLTHEIYHVMQQVASRKVPELKTMLDNLDQLPLDQRLFAETLWEGTASYASDPLRSNESGPYITMWREKHQSNLTPERILRNFQLFDTLLSELSAQRMTWDEAYAKGFAGESPLYFVGYEMARVIGERCGSPCIGKLFQHPPIEFFRQYVAIYKADPEVRARFSADTEVRIGN